MEDPELQEFNLAELYIDDRLTGKRIVSLLYRPSTKRGSILVDGNLFPTKYTGRDFVITKEDPDGIEHSNEFPYQEDFPCANLVQLLLGGRKLDFSYQQKNQTWQARVKENILQEERNIPAQASISLRIILDLNRCLAEFETFDFVDLS